VIENVSFFDSKYSRDHTPLAGVEAELGAGSGLCASLVKMMIMKKLRCDCTVNRNLACRTF